MGLPLVSVIIPAYNCAAYLPISIESGLAQSHSNVELIVVNDGSPDNTDEAVRPYLHRIKYIKQENKGLCAARNAGFKESTGAFINFLDADDTLLPQKIERQLLEFQADPGLDEVICGWYDINEKGERLRESLVVSSEYGLDQLMAWQVFPPHAALLRRSAFERVGGFDETIPTQDSQEDWHLWLRMALTGSRFARVPEVLIEYRKRDGSISRNFELHVGGAERVIRMLEQSGDPRITSHHARKLRAMLHVRLASGRLRNGDITGAAKSLVEGWKAVGEEILSANTWNYILANGAMNCDYEFVKAELTPLFDELPTGLRKRFEASCFITVAENLQWEGKSLQSLPMVYAAARKDFRSILSNRGLKAAIRPFLH